MNKIVRYIKLLYKDKEKEMAQAKVVKLNAEISVRQKEKEKLEFDKERLASEIDVFFQEKTVNNLKSFTEATVDIVKIANNKLDSIVHNHIDELDKNIKEAIKDNKQKIIDEIIKGRTIIHIAEKKMDISVGHMDHPETESVIKSLALYRKAMLVGPAGTGKTTMVSNIAAAMKVPFYKYSCSRDSSVHDLLGYKQPKSETYLNTTFLKCYEEGGIFLVDEYDAMSGDMALFFNGVADNSKFISVPHRDGKPTATKHKDFLLIMCGNTWGKGSYEYSGRDFQDKALLDRFRFCRHYVNYHFGLEKALLGSNYCFGMELRKELESLGSYLSTRNIEDIATCLKNDLKKEVVFEMAIHDLPDSDKTYMNNKKKEICKQ